MMRPSRESCRRRWLPRQVGGSILPGTVCATAARVSLWPSLGSRQHRGYGRLRQMGQLPADAVGLAGRETVTLQRKRCEQSVCRSFTTGASWRFCLGHWASAGIGTIASRGNLNEPTCWSRDWRPAALARGSCSPFDDPPSGYQLWGLTSRQPTCRGKTLLNK